jgi:hypothetical protein
LVSTAGDALAITLGLITWGFTVCADGAKFVLRR